jgi:hypothetical protein
VENNSPAKAGLVGGKLLDLYKRGGKTRAKKRVRTRAKTQRKK